MPATRALATSHLDIPGATPLFTACCPTWPTTGGRHHERTCHLFAEETA
ncbi:hypothetical protein [Streptomyces sioyaensis]